MSHYSSKNNLDLPADPVAGFTLVELLVSLSIVAVILTVVLSNQSTYTDRAALLNLADEIALTISQAQAYSIGVKESSVGSGEFSSSYGVVFNIALSGSPYSYIYFADLNEAGNDDNFYNGDWSCTPGDECINKTNITRGNSVESICIVPIVGEDDCDDIDRVDISFARPNTEAQIYFDGVAINLDSMKGAKINLVSPGGHHRSVSVFSTGQISVQ